MYDLAVIGLGVAGLEVLQIELKRIERLYKIAQGEV